MRKRIKSLLLTALLLLTVAGLQAASPIKNGRAQGRIVLTTDNTVDAQAARLLQDFLQRISSATLPVITGNRPRRGDIAIGNGAGNASVDRQLLKEDGFRIVNTGADGIVRIVSGDGNGSIYAAVTLLEQYLGVNYWGENEYTIVPRHTIDFPPIDRIDNPAFRYRQSQHYALDTDTLYALWMRLRQPGDVFAGGLWVHTFNSLLPASVYGDAHPEYYAYYDGQRHPGSAGQWCLSNPDVLQIVAERLDSIFRAHPDRKIISVSQNDGNFTYCQCDSCRAVDDHEEAHSGSLIRFVNRLAERFPDRQISTLAYLYTMKPPRYIRPLPNVNIMLCSIDCNREVSLTENSSGREFMAALEGWSCVSNNIFVWDYGINFDNYLSPFPNLHVMPDNIRLFHRHHASMHFSQIAGSRGGDFAELRTWFAAKLMWNPAADADSLLSVFLNGYYGAAAGSLYQYIKLMEGALIGSGQRLWIYDSPVSHKDGMLKRQLMQRYEALFDRAEAAVAGDSTKLARVRRSRLPLQYAALEIARTHTARDTADVLHRLSVFEQRIQQFNVSTLNERNNSPLVYCDLYRTRYLTIDSTNLALGATIDFQTPPDAKYAAMARTALTDGLYGGATFGESWIGWEGIDACFTVDLGSERSFSTIETDFLHQLGQWILLPLQVRYAISKNGSDFLEVASIDVPEDRDMQVKFHPVVFRSPSMLRARYVKVSVTGTKRCPHWHYGVGHPCWFFIDEVVVRK
jgi:hypothetical protein